MSRSPGEKLRLRIIVILPIGAGLFILHHEFAVRIPRGYPAPGGLHPVHDEILQLRLVSADQGNHVRAVQVDVVLHFRLEKQCAGREILVMLLA